MIQVHALDGGYVRSKYTNRLKVKGQKKIFMQIVTKREGDGWDIILI